MRKLTNLQKTIVALAAASLLIASQANAGTVVGPTDECAPGVVRTVGAGLVWALDTDGGGGAEIGPFFFGTAATDTPIVGDWDNNMTTNVGITRALGNSRVWRLDTNADPAAETVRVFGRNTDTSVAGRFLAAGNAPVPGSTRVNASSPTPNALIWKLDTADDGGAAETTIIFGRSTDTPIVGDWDGDGTDNIGVIRVVGGLNKAFLDTNGGGTAEIVYNFGDAANTIVPCDYDGSDTTDLASVGGGAASLRWRVDTGNNGGAGESFIDFGNTTGDTPVAGDWDGPM